jgi:hypothetical protein
MPEGREIILGSVIDEGENAIGLSLPFNTENGSMFGLNFLSIDQAISNVKNLILTRKGERINHPEFGTDLQSFIFEPNFPDLREAIGEEIRSAIEQWLPYIIINNLEVRVPNAREGGLVDRYHGVYVDLNIGLLNNTIDEAEIVLEIKDV